MYTEDYLIPIAALLHLFFYDRFISKRSRTHDQIMQAVRLYGQEDIYSWLSHKRLKEKSSNVEQ